MDATSTLVRALHTNRLLTPGQLDEVARELCSRFPEARSLARELLQRGWLTPFQINQVLAGRGADLVLGQYVLLERLGEGGMGTVYKARQQTLDRIVAIKVIRKERLSNPILAKRFVREVQAAAQLSHPNIVMAYDADQIGATSFLVMEYVEGTDLGRLVKQSGPLPVAQACDFIRQAALGLQHAHDKGMVHRDIKPSNLLVTKPTSPGNAFGQVKILDMGLARLQETDENSGTALTHEGSVVGTPDFIAPEQAMDSHLVDIRADIYSLGCTFYYLLAGQVPFPGGTALEKLLKHRLEPPTPIEQLRPEVPPHVAAVLRRMLAKRPEERYQTPAAVAAALAEGTATDFAAPPVASTRSLPVLVTAHGHTPAEAVETTDLSRPRASAPRSRRQLLLLGGGGLAAALLLGGLLLVTGRSGPGSVTEKPSATESEPESPAAAALRELLARPRQTAAEQEALRQAIVAFRVRYPGTPEAHRAAKLLRQLSSPLDGIESKGLDWKTQSFFTKQGVELAAVVCRPPLFPLRHTVRSLAFTPDGRALVAGRDEGIVHVWEFPSLQQMKFSPHKDRITALACSPDGKLAASASHDEPVKLWEVSSGREGPRLPAQANGVWSAAFAPDAQAVAWGSDDGQIRLWRLGGGKPPEVFTHGSPVHALAFAPSGKTLASAGRDGSLRIWDLAAHTSRQLQGHKGRVTCLAYSPDGQLLASGSYDQTVKLWETATGKELKSLPDHASGVAGVAFAPDGQSLASMSAGGAIYRWDPSTGKQLQEIRLPFAGHCLAFAPDGRHLAAACGPGMVLIFRLGTLR
jgi:serine/threonine-protein kinase